MAEGQEFEIGGAHLECMHCRSKRFTEGSALLNTRGLTFFNLDWLNRAARVLACANCGFLHWFAADATAESTQSYETECMSCGAHMSVGAKSCNECGWTYREHDGEDANVR